MPLNVGIVGGGFMAGAHCHAARKAHAKVVGLVSSSEESTRQAADRFGIHRAFGSLAELLADDEIQVVHITTPNALHAEQALAAIEAGKHVICEKPLATTVEDATLLVRAAGSSGITATVALVYRFHAIAREARARVRAERIGRLLCIHGSYLQDWLLGPAVNSWRLEEEKTGPSRAFADIGSHLVDLTEFVTGDRIKRMAVTMHPHLSHSGHLAARRTEDSVAVAIETTGGAIGTLLISQVTPGHTNTLRLEIAGNLESVEYCVDGAETMWVGRRGHREKIAPDPDTSLLGDARLSILPAGLPQFYQGAFNAFVADTYAAVAGEEPDGLPRFEDGLRAVCVTEAALRSAERHEWVDIARPTT